MAERADFERLTPWRSRDDVADTLRRAREERGATLTEAAQATCITPQYLEALEDDAPLNTFPAPAYARFFLREYAQYLRLDDSDLVEAFVERHGGDFEDEALADELVVPLVPLPSRRMPRFLAILSALLLVGVGVFASSQRDESSPMPELPSAGSQADGSPGAQAPDEGGTKDGRERDGKPPAHGMRAVLTVTDSSWVDASSEGRTLIHDTLDPGSERTVRANRRLELRLGNAGGVELTVNGERVRTGPDNALLTLLIVLRDDGLHVRRPETTVSV